MHTPYLLRQQAFRQRFDPWKDGFGPRDAMIVVLPSISFDPAELRKITAVERYEERLLCLLLLLRQPRRRMVYLSAMPVDPVIVDYYLNFLPDPQSARARLDLLSPGDPRPSSLTGKLLARADLLERLDALVEHDRDNAYVLPFNVTDLEQRFADRLRLPLYGPDPQLASLGSKSGSRRIARRAGVEVLDGHEDLWSVADVEEAIERLSAPPTNAAAVVVKLNDSFSGQGNAIVDCRAFSSPATAAPTRFCAAGEDWASYAAKIRSGGAIVERLLTDHFIASPSVQLRITPGGDVEVLSTHDQVLGGPDHQVYLGCRFPAGSQYRPLITAAARKVAAALRDEGVIGAFGIDFFVRATSLGDLQVALSEINLRLGGTTHPFLMAKLLTDSTYDVRSGRLEDDNGRAICYVASDNLRSPRLIGVSPGDVLDALEHAGLAYQHDTGEGVTCHLLGALPQYGKMGITCLASTIEAADDLYREATAVLAERSLDSCRRGSRRRK